MPDGPSAETKEPVPIKVSFSTPPPVALHEADSTAKTVQNCQVVNQSAVEPSEMRLTAVYPAVYRGGADCWRGPCGLACRLGRGSGKPKAVRWRLAQHR